MAAAPSPAPHADAPPAGSAARAVANRNSALVVLDVLVDAFFPYRGLAPERPEELGRDAFVRDLDRIGYVRLAARRAAPRGARDLALVFVLAPEGRYSRHTPDLRKLLEGGLHHPAVKAGQLDELVLVADDGFFERAALLELVEDYRARLGEVRGADVAGRGPFVSVRPYRNFVTDIPRCRAVHPHALMTPAQVEEHLAWHRLRRADLPAIQDDDPPVVWLGGREGQCVRVERASETAGRAVVVRRVIRAPAPSDTKARAAGRGGPAADKGEPREAHD